MQILLNAIQEFEAWSGIPVNTLKTKQMTVDGIETNRTIIEELTYHDKPLPIAPESESVRYLGFWQPPTAICRRPRTWYMTGRAEPRKLSRVTR
jgi:hypothetical protein